VVIGGLLGLQIALGIINVTMNLPLTVAVMHNGVAALLLIALVYLLYKTRQASYN
jgi:cytochrome c oxidase assembly protein subunit 15